MGEGASPSVMADPAAGAGEALAIVGEMEGVPKEFRRGLVDLDGFPRWWRDTVDVHLRFHGAFVEAWWRDPTGRSKATRAEFAAFQPPVGSVMVLANADVTLDTVLSVSLDRIPVGRRVTTGNKGRHFALQAVRSDLKQQHRDVWARHLASLADHANEHHARRKGH